MLSTQAPPPLSPAGDEFFIGYEPPMPPGIARFVRRVVIIVAGSVLICGAALAPGHVPLQGGTFEFGHPRTFSGTIVDAPVPALRPDAEDGREPWPLLVAPGKHGASDLVRGLVGRHVTLTGTRIARGRETMIEVEPASIVADSTSTPGDVTSATVAPVVLRGEIVDSKCFLGVMVPGAGKTHKECASLCLRGGIPPALFVQDRSGASSLLLVTGPSGEAVTDAALLAAGEAIELTGTVTRSGGWLVVRSDPSTWHRISQRGLAK